MRPSRRSSRLSIRPLALASLLGCLRFAGYAQAQTLAKEAPTDDALLQACQQELACRSHLDRATQLYELNRYSAALDEYAATYILQPYPLILYNIARLHHKLGHLPDAVSYYERYLATAHSQLTERARQYLAAAQQELAAQSAVTPPHLAAVAAAPPAIVTRPLLTNIAVSTPAYKKWWFWTLIGIGSVGGATAVGLGIYECSSMSHPSSTLRSKLSA